MEVIKCEKEVLDYGIRKNNPPPFLLKTYMLVDDHATDAVISWNGGGTAFVVWQPAEFAQDLLPTLFKHSNFSSFVRQLNTYGFKKVTTSRWEFSNDMFQKDKKELLGQIRRRKSCSHRQQPPQVVAPLTTTHTQSKAPQNHDEDQRSSSTSSSCELNVLVDENKRLKKENGELSTELKTLKKKCKELLHELVVIYTNMSEKKARESLDNCDENWPKLFGVRLEVQGERERKRKRSTDHYETARIVLSHSCK